MTNFILRPDDIEKRSFEIITAELGGRTFPEERADIIKRVIHTTADFDYADNLVFSENAVQSALAALKGGANIVTDTNMAFSGINKRSAAALGCGVNCFMADEDVAAEAKSRSVTRAVVSMEKAARLDGKTIFAIGNAPTALLRLCELYDEGKISPALVVGVPVGFVNVVEAKEMLIKSGMPYIAARGRKGGSNVAAAVINALLYKITRETLI
ncbi:MAG: precorrin-8X methylmutase [Firmicutes bacterium]|nr:precorrin-8X methylmutase [Bacillota bacterium]